MTESEEYFPRGKVPPGVKKANKVAEDGGGGNKAVVVVKRKAVDKLENLFATTDEKPVKKAKKTNKKNKLTSEEEKTLAGKRRAKEDRFSVVPLTFDQIVEGMLSLGIVTQIRDHEISINLPGRCGGIVSITNISTPYLKFLEDQAEGKGPKEDVIIYTLRDMFHVGQCVVVKVKDVKRSDKTKVILSMNPQDLYDNYSTTVLKEDLVMIAAVSSEEDHGYVMDVGINGARCFLPKDDAQKFVTRANRNQPLGIGQLVYCKIKKIHFHRLIANITLTSVPKVVQSKKMDEIGLNYATLMPGMLADAIVMETHKTGIMAHCLDLNALIHQDYMKDDWAMPESLEVGSTIPARVLYTLPNLTTPYLTLQSNVMPFALLGDRTDRNKLGAKIKVRIVRTEKRGLIVRFDDGNKGIVPLNHIGNDSLLTEEDISKKYKNGSEHDCRVLHYCPMERSYLCSFRKDNLESDAVHIEQATPGKLVTCTLLRWNKGGVIVQFGSGMHGYIPNSLFKATLVKEDAKEKLINKEMKARIFERNASMQKIILTTRKEFARSSGAVINSVKEATVGMTGDAIIKFLGNSGAFVRTIGGTEGFIPKSKLTKVRLSDFKEAFHIGQSIQYKVLEADKGKNRLIMSAITEDDDATSSEKEAASANQTNKKQQKRKVNVEEGEGGDETEPKKKRIRRRRRKNKSKTEDIELKTEIKSESDSEPEIESAQVKAPVKQKSVSNEEDRPTLKLPERANFWDATEIKEESETESDSGDESSQQTKKQKKKKTKEVIVSKNKQNGSPLVTSESLEMAEKFENGVISSPNDPTYWIKLMTHYNSVGNIEKARGVAKQGLDTLNFRDEKGKLKIWGALFQLEIKYGTEDTVKKTFADALQRTDQLECLKLMALVYDKADRFRDAERTYRQLTKQFRLEPDAWIRFGTFYYQREKADLGRDILNEALPIVAASKQVLLITKFALLELHHGEQARGESMLDRVLSQYPQRCDLWMLYVNSLIKLNDFDKARSVFHRALDISWNPRKVKPLLKRFQEFESAHGTESTQAEFQNIALKALNIQSDE